SSALWFFFSSRRRHTRFSRDWSSDVCSSDLVVFAFIISTIAGRGTRFEEKNWFRILIFFFTLAASLLLATLVHPNLNLSALGEEIGRASCRERVGSSEVGGGGRTEREEGKGC